MKSERLKYSLLIGIVAAFLFIPLLGKVHLFDWDEINFAEISREMLILEDYLRVYVNFLPFWEKPPFFFWLQAAAMSVFGINEFAARFPNAICGICTLIILFNIGKTLFNTRFGLLWAGAYLGSVLPFLYFKSGIIDPWFNLFILLGLYYFIKFYWKKDSLESAPCPLNKWNYLLLSGLFIGLGIITKGPVAYLIPVLCLGVYWIIKRFKFFVTPLHFVLFTISSSIVMLTWYGLETMKNGYWFIHEFNKYQIRLFSTPDAGHAGFPGYHFVVLLIGVFPASIFCIRSFFKSPKTEFGYQQDFKLWMSILFWVVLILFTIVKSKIVHYSSMCYFPMTFLAAFSMYQIMENKIQFNIWMKRGIIAIALFYIIVAIAIPIVGQHIDWIKPLFSKDPFAMANLEAEVHWNYFQIIPGLFLCCILIWSFNYFTKHNYLHGFYSLFCGTAVFVMLMLIFDINNFEGYSQRAAIEFYKSKAGEDCYIITHGFKSYGHLYYAQKRKVTNPESYNNQWLLEGDVDKPVYFVAKITKADELKQYPQLDELYRKNGFVFFKRKTN
jgi:4-amino-4-deoxy-L-arabinose transferase-like glycosyltransferase